MNREFYAVHGKTHRYEGPAVTTFYDDGTKGSESYHRHGSGPHRFDGPAMIEYREDGTLIYARFQFDGKGYDGPPVLHGALEGLEDDWLRDELRGTIYGELATDGSDLSAVAAALGAGVRTVEGIREVLDGAPIEWVRAYEEGRR